MSESNSENFDNSEPPKSVNDLKVPDEFYKIINDFVIDILTTFL